MIDSRDFLSARHRADTELMLPAGPKIALTGGLEFNDHQLIWDRLDKVHAKHPDMVLLHGGSPKGAELIAAKWATQRKVQQIAFKPDWTKHAKAAPFKRNDAMLAVLPIGVMVFPGTGIQANLADKAKKLGIPVWKFGEGGAERSLSSPQDHTRRPKKRSRFLAMVKRRKRPLAPPTFATIASCWLATACTPSGSPRNRAGRPAAPRTASN
jgi:YspA, cpYpsA-related SLOG family